MSGYKLSASHKVANRAGVGLGDIPQDGIFVGVTQQVFRVVAEMGEVHPTTMLHRGTEGFFSGGTSELAICRFDFALPSAGHLHW